jgi:hypothetical protein
VFGVTDKYIEGEADIFTLLEFLGVYRTQLRQLTASFPQQREKDLEVVLGEDLVNGFLRKASEIEGSVKLRSTLSGFSRFESFVPQINTKYLKHMGEAFKEYEGTDYPLDLSISMN